MASPRDIRRLALLALYQIDAHDGAVDEEALDRLRASLDGLEALRDEGLAFADGTPPFRERDREKAIAAAVAAWSARAEADATTRRLAPEWPAHRQAAIDRCILRLAHHELAAGTAPPRAVVNEAVELAKAFSTEKSPAFVNALLDKIMGETAARAAAERASTAVASPSADHQTGRAPSAAGTPDEPASAT